VSLSLVAREVDNCHGWYCDHVKAIRGAVVLGFLAFGLLLASVLDFGNPDLVSLVVAVERPASGVWKLASSVSHGQPDEEGQEHEEVHVDRRTRRSNPRMPPDDNV